MPARAETCGATEEIVGRWLKSRNNRNQVILATKVTGGPLSADLRFVVANRYAPRPDSSTVGLPHLDAKSIRDAVEGSLRRLQTPYIDLYQIHWPERYVPIFGWAQYRESSEHDYLSFEEQVQTMGDLIKEGKIRHWGLSNETTYGVCKFNEVARQLGLPPPVSIQNDFSLLDRRFETELAEACSKRHYNMGLLPYGPLAGGTLSGKYLDEKKPCKSRHTMFPGFQPRYYCDPSLKATQRYADMAQRRGLTPTQLALAWVKSRPYVSSTIIGATTMEQLKEDIQAFDLDLDGDTLKEIDVIHRQCRNPNLYD